MPLICTEGKMTGALEEIRDARSAYLEACAKTFCNVRFYFKDYWLSPDLVSGYVPGSILVDRRSVTVSTLAEGLTANVRFCYATNQVTASGSGEHAAPEHRVLGPSHFYKVLDTWSHRFAIQVTVLQVSPQARAMIHTTATDFEQALVRVARDNFRLQVTRAPLVASSRDTTISSPPLGLVTSSTGSPQGTRNVYEFGRLEAYGPNEWQAPTGRIEEELEGQLDLTALCGAGLANPQESDTDPPPAQFPFFPEHS